MHVTSDVACEVALCFHFLYSSTLCPETDLWLYRQLYFGVDNFCDISINYNIT